MIVKINTNKHYTCHFYLTEEHLKLLKKYPRLFSWYAYFIQLLQNTEAELRNRLAPHLYALLAIFLLALGLRLFRLEQDGFSNLYYAATVQSILTSWHNFFFVSFDPAGFVSVDKPPLGFWIQALSVSIFGFHGWALILPQALAGALSTLMLYHLVKRVFGVNAGILAALILAITPISVATDRSNTPDGQLTFVLLLAALAAIKAAESGKLRWLVACAALVGIGFNVKMLPRCACFLFFPAAAARLAQTPRPTDARHACHVHDLLRLDHGGGFYSRLRTSLRWIDRHQPRHRVGRCPQWGAPTGTDRRLVRDPREGNAPIHRRRH